MEATASLSFANLQLSQLHSNNSNKISNMFEQTSEYLELQSSARFRDVIKDIIDIQEKIISYSNTRISLLPSDCCEKCNKSSHQILNSALEILLNITNSAYNILQQNFTNFGRFSEQNKSVALQILNLLEQANQLFNLNQLNLQNIEHDLQQLVEKIANILIDNSFPRGDRNSYKRLNIRDLESLIQVKKKPIQQLAISKSKSDYEINIRQNSMPSCDLLTRYMIADNLSICPVVRLSSYKILQNNLLQEKRYFLHFLYSQAQQFNYYTLQRLRNAGYEIYQDDDSFIAGIGLPISYHYKMLVSTTANKLLGKIYAKRITAVQTLSDNLVVKFVQTNVNSLRNTINLIFKYDSSIRQILLLNLQDLDAEQKISEYKISYEMLLKMQNTKIANYVYSNNTSTMKVLQILEDFFHEKHGHVHYSNNQTISKAFGINQIKSVTSHYISGNERCCEFFCANLSLWFNNLISDRGNLVLNKLRDDNLNLKQNQRIKLSLVLEHDAESDAIGHAVFFLGWQIINGIEYIKFQNPHGHVEYLSTQAAIGHLRNYQIFKMFDDDNDEEVSNNNLKTEAENKSSALILFEQIMKDDRHDYSSELLLPPIKICQVKKHNKIDLGAIRNFTAADASNNFIKIHNLQERLIKHEYYQFFCQYEIEATFSNAQVHLAIIDYKKSKLEVSRDYAIKQSNLILMKVISLLEYQSGNNKNLRAKISLIHRIKNDSHRNVKILEQTVTRYVNDLELAKKIIADAREAIMLD
jgi:hypothetical protein